MDGGFGDSGGGGGGGGGHQHQSRMSYNIFYVKKLHCDATDSTDL